MQTPPAYPSALQILQEFSPISLSEMDSVHLLNRVDRKYALHVRQLPHLVQHLKTHYQILEIDGQRCFRYSTTYFDTPDLLLYQAHHNSMSNRIKIRCRQYLDSGKCYFEIKQKQLGHRTHKLRYEIAAPLLAVDTPAYAAIRQQYYRLPLHHLGVSLHNTFTRITLASRQLNERCTIDMDLRFQSPDGREAVAKDIVVVELKQARMNPMSPMMQALRAERIFPCSFSKYIFGLLQTRQQLKHNAFKPLLHRLEKIKSSYTNTHHPIIARP